MKPPFSAGSGSGFQRREQPDRSPTDPRRSAWSSTPREYRAAAGQSFVPECFESVQSCRAAGAEEGSRDACSDGNPAEKDELGEEQVEANAEAGLSACDECGEE